KWIITLMVLIITENNGISGKEVRVKLCGREFIRMVVTLCGSSRLRRFAPELIPVSISPQGGSLLFILFNTVSLVSNVNSLNLIFSFISETQYISDLFPDLTSLKSSSEDQNINDSLEKHLNSSSSLSLSSSSSSSSFLKITQFSEHSSLRLQRDVGPAGVCCRSGCTKTELVQYC
ncbi:hypothetical protein C0J50_9643, partial [Silurus asotus]